VDEGAGTGAVQAVIDRMAALLAPMDAAGDPRRHFLATYRRTTIAVHEALQSGRFEDVAWVVRWDVAFASLYLDALDAWNTGGEVPGPWRVAFAAAADGSVPPLRHVLLGMNAHINYDLPQAILATVSSADLDDPATVERRHRDHTAVDAILASRVDAEDRELQRVERPGQRTWLDRVLTPFNRAATKRFMTESRRKVWANTVVLDRARRRGPDELAVALRGLEVASEARVADLRAPGQVLLRLARRGFGVELPPA
jgi:hypothetical protein